MEVNEQIVTGQKFRCLMDEAAKLWQRISFWTKANDVEFDDGMNAETKVGAISGITDSLASTSSHIAASAKAVHTLSNNLVSDVYVGNDGKLHKVQGGADTALPFSRTSLASAIIARKEASRGQSGVASSVTCTYTVPEQYYGRDAIVIFTGAVMYVTASLRMGVSTGGLGNAQILINRPDMTYTPATMAYKGVLQSGTLSCQTPSHAQRISAEILVIL